MEKIAELVAKLENNIPVKIQNKLKSLDRLNVKLDLVKKEHEDEPTEDSKEQLDNILEYVAEVKDELIEDLEKAVEKAEKAKTPIVETPIVEAPVVETPIVEKPVTIVETPKQKEKEESSGIGWFGLIGGVVLLVATAGLVNTLRK